MEELARVYSRALFESAKEQGKTDQVRDQLGSFAEALESNRDLKQFFFSPSFLSRDKKDGLKRSLIGVDPLMLNFLYLLVDKHRMPVIFSIRKGYDALWAKDNQLLNVEVVSACTLEPKTLDGIRQKIESQTGRKVDLNGRIDTDVIGGMVLHVGNWILDASIRSQLEQLRKQIATA